MENATIDLAGIIAEIAVLDARIARIVSRRQRGADLNRDGTLARLTARRRSLGAWVACQGAR